MLAPLSWLDFLSSEKKVEIYIFPLCSGNNLEKKSRQCWRTDNEITGRGGACSSAVHKKKIVWLDWFSDLALQLELVQELQMRKIKGPWWQPGVGALGDSSRRVVLYKLICPWHVWNKPAYIHSSEEPLSIWCPAAEPHKKRKQFQNSFPKLAKVTFVEKRKLLRRWQPCGVCWLN